MEAMCEWCGQVVPVGLDGTCFLGHSMSASVMATASAASTHDDAPLPQAYDLDIATAPDPLDTVPPLPDFAAMPPPLTAPPIPVDQGPVPPVLAPQGPAFAAAAPQPPQVPLIPPAPPPMPVAAVAVPQPVGAAAGPVPLAANPVDAAFAPLISAELPNQVPSQPSPLTGPGSGPTLPPQAPTGPGWQAVHIADDVAVFEYRPPGGAVPGDGMVGTLPPANTRAPQAGFPTEQTPVLHPPGPGTGPLPTAYPGGPPPGDPYHSVVSEEEVATFAPGDELDIPHSGSRTRQIVLLAILVVVALAAGLAFAFGLI